MRVDINHTPPSVTIKYKTANERRMLERLTNSSGLVVLEKTPVPDTEDDFVLKTKYVKHAPVKKEDKK